MAIILGDKDLDKVAVQLGINTDTLKTSLAGMSEPNNAVATGSPTNTAASTTNNTTQPAGGLSGVSSGTQSNLNNYAAGYQPSDAVNQAYAYLQNLLNNKPGDYASNWTDKLNGLYDQIINRDKFSYDLNSDPLYNQYKEQYTTLGQQAMMDTMGQASMLTGGYGNSYASTAGNQAYQSYLQQLNDKVPEMYAEARDAYAEEGQNLYNQFALTQSMDATDYGRYRDEVSDYYNDLGFASDSYNSERNFDYNNYSNMLNYWQNQASMENADYWNEQNFNEDIRQFDLSFNEQQRQFDESMAYQKIRDAATDAQWAKEFDEKVKQAKVSESQWAQSFAETVKQNGIANDQWAKQFQEYVRQNNISYEQWKTELEQNRQQFEQNFAEQQRQFDAKNQYDYDTFAEQQRQYNASLAEEQRQFNAKQATSNTSSSASSGGTNGGVTPKATANTKYFESRYTTKSFADYQKNTSGTYGPMKKYGSYNDYVLDMLDQHVNNGSLTIEEAEYLYAKYGLKG